MLDSGSHRSIKREIVACLVFLLALLVLASKGMSQVTHCSIVNRLNNVETNITELVNDVRSNHIGSSNQYLQVLARETISMIRRIESQQFQMIVAEQLTHRTDWIRDYLFSRNEIADLYLEGNWSAFRQRVTTRNFRQISDDLVKIKSIVPCMAGNFSGNGPDQQFASSRQDSAASTSEYVETRDGQLASASQLISALTQIVSEYARSIVAITILAFSLAGFWLASKYDNYRKQCRKRYHCHVDVVLANSVSAQNGYAINISRNGVGLVVERSIIVGTVLALKAGGWQRQIRVVRTSGNDVGAIFLKRLKKIPGEFDITGQKKWASRTDFKNSPRGKEVK